MSECNHNSQVYLEEVIARKNERIAELETTMDAVSALIDAAPHAISCREGMLKKCTCWKSKILKEQGR